jgi:hypothetical protein
MARLAQLPIFFVLALASWAGAVDTVMPGAGRQAGAVPVAMPYNFSAGLKLQAAPSSLPSININVGQTPGLPSMAELRSMGEVWLGVRANNQTAIPTLPQSLVISGEVSNTALMPTGSAVLTPSQETGLSADVVRKTPPAPEIQVPGMKRVSEELTQKTASLHDPLEIAAKSGPNAPSSESARRAGDEIWDILSAPGRSDESSLKGGSVFAGGMRGESAGSGLSSEGASYLGASREGGGSKGSPTFGAVSVPSAETEGPQNAAARESSLNASSPRDSGETPQAGQAVFTPRAVALITMDVVGQSLVLSDAGTLAAARRAAAAVESAMAVDGESRIEGLALRDAVLSPKTSNWTAAETLGSRVVAPWPLMSESSASGQNTADSDFGALRADRARTAFLSNVFEGSGLWSLAGLLPLLLLALTTLPDYLKS